MLCGNDLSRDVLVLTTFPAMFNRSCTRYADIRCQWYRKDFSQPTELSFNTYGEVRRIVQDMTCGLLEMGLKPQERVGLMSTNCPEWLWSDFSILCAAAVTVPLYPTLSAEETTYILNDSGAKYVYVRDNEGAQKIASIMKDLPALEKVIVFDDKVELANEKFMHLSTLRERGKRYAAKNRSLYMQTCESVNLWDMATIVYTSGTTGKPKGVVHTHYTFMSSVMGDLANFILSGYFNEPGDICMSVLPLSHTFERQCSMMNSVITGQTIAYAENTTTLLRDLQIFNPHWFTAVPRIFERIYTAMRDAASVTPEGKEAFERAVDIGERVISTYADEEGFLDFSLNKDFSEGLPEDLAKEYEWAKTAVFNRIRGMMGKNFAYANTGSASMPARLTKAFAAMGIRLSEGYGLTETMNAYIKNTMPATLPGSVGRSKVTVEIRLDEDGELLVRGDNIFLGYWNNPEADAAAFTEDGFFRTGDIGERFFSKTYNDYWYRVVDRKSGIMVLDTGKNVPRVKVESRFTVSHYVETICAVADARKFVSAIVVPKFATVIEKLAKEGITFDESQFVKVDGVIVKVGDDLANHPQVRALIDKDIEEANKTLEDYEQIKKYIISNRVFSPDLGELTPTLKLKIRNVIKNLLML